MAASQKDARKQIERITTELSPTEIERRLLPKFDPAPPQVPGATKTTPETVEKRCALLPHDAAGRGAVADSHTLATHADFARNIENFIGTVKVPVGLVGPLRVNGLVAQGDYYLPLATTEAALVASYHRGAGVITEAGGCSVITLNEGVSRAPFFAFRTLLEAGRFVQWCLEHENEIRAAADATTRHGRLQNLRFTVEGNHVYLLCEFTTGDASGQNMVTISAQAIYNLLEATCPIRPAYGFVESNFSGDKKSSSQSFQSVRGRKVTAEVRVPRAVVRRRLHTTPEKMLEFWKVSAMGGVLSGTIGI
ncbi:MAG: 3-hydroxy-3-methylglutaryl-CoA reductase, partial [Verrucomicrobiota bacterium]